MENFNEKPPSIDMQKFFKERELEKINSILGLEGENKENDEHNLIENLKKLFVSKLEGMIDFLSTTEADQASARAYYSELYKETFNEIQGSVSLDDLTNVLKKIRFEDISARFYGTIRRDWKSLYTLGRRGIRDIDWLKEPSINYFNKIMPTLIVIQTWKK